VRVRGEARVHLQVTPSTPSGTVTAYLLDVADDGDTAFIVAQAPHTFRGAAPGVPLSFDVRTPYNAYDLPAGHRLPVAVSTGDPTYANENADGSTLRIDAASYVDVPLNLQSGDHARFGRRPVTRARLAPEVASKPCMITAGLVVRPSAAPPSRRRRR
jgi:predicted acyl esterase